eukprot:151910-Ditylum_brightwellii.AAC.1
MARLRLYRERWHPRPSPLQHPGPVKLTAGRFPYWNMVQWPENSCHQRIFVLYHGKVSPAELRAST